MAWVASAMGTATLNKIYPPNEEFVNTEFHRKPITEKFWTVPEKQTPEFEATVERNRKVLALKQSQGPRDIWCEPVVTSYDYGWYPGPIVEIDRKDKRFFHGHEPNEMIHTESLILQQFGYKPKWTGKPFYLQ